LHPRQPAFDAAREWYVPRALSGRRVTSFGIVAGIAASFALSACGGSGSRQDAAEPAGVFPVQVTIARFPTVQRLSEHTRLVIAVRNTGRKAIPNIAVTITDPQRGTSVRAFAQYNNMGGLSNHNRPVWIVDRYPGPCRFSCAAGGPGAAVTAYSNTWALGRLRPGDTATFSWSVTAVTPGVHEIQYEVAAGLNGKAKARLSGGGVPQGRFKVAVSSKPAQQYVDNSGNIVNQ